MTTASLKVYFDVVSPFGYLAYHILRHDPVFANIKITYIPILLGGVMKACGNTAPLHIKNKSTWINTERRTWARIFAIPINETMPPNFPVNTLHVQRAFCALSALHPNDKGQELTIRILDVLLEKFWVQHEKVYEREVFAGIFEGVLGREEGGIVTSPTSPLAARAKSLLTANTEQALADGAFGLPWIVATNGKGKQEGFWGVDHLGVLCDFMGLDVPGRSGSRSGSGVKRVNGEEKGGEGQKKEGGGGWKSLL